jgi:hypothetical protein
MKKQILLLAGAAILFASCGDNNANDNAADSQAKIDSAVKAKEDEFAARQKAIEDSTIAALEAAKAAQMEAAKKTDKAIKTVKNTKAPAPAPTPTVAPAPPPNAKEDRFSNDKKTEGTKVAPSNTDKKADRFK